MLSSLTVGLIITLTAFTATAASSNSTLEFSSSFAGYENYFYRDNVTACQVVLSQNASSAPTRFVAAFPAGNSGLLMFFIPEANTSTGSIVMSNGSLVSVSGDYGNAGIEGVLDLTGNFDLGVAILGGVRSVRDYTEGNGLMHSIFNYTLGNYNESSFTLNRDWINGTKSMTATFTSLSPSNLAFDITPSPNYTATAPNISFVSNSTTSNQVGFKILFNETSLIGLDREDLFLSSPPSANTSTALQRTIANVQPGSVDDSQSTEVSFLTYQNKFTAGGWRFLTYFGRDSMITLKLMMPILTSQSIEAALGAVIERTNATGALCHEETIGDYASFVNIGNGDYSKGNQPYYDYKMVDTDFLLLPSLSHYFLSVPQGTNRSTAFLSQNATLQNGTYLSLLMKNINHVLNMTTDFAENPTKENLIAIRDVVGDWRDSNEGLGYGTVPFDVNTALVPAALRSIQALSSAGIIPSNYSTPALKAAVAFETYAPEFFKVTLSAGTAKYRLNNFVSKANLSDSLLYGQGSLNGTVNSTGWANNSATGEKGFEFYGLSLKDGEIVEVMNSDLSFTLHFSSNVSKSIIEATVEALQPYPRGLLTNIGMVVANPAYDSNKTNIDVLNRGAYHGTVFWSFQQGLMAAGIARQLSLCNATTSFVDYPDMTQFRPEWCSDQALVSSLQTAEASLWKAIHGASSVLYTEVWSYDYSNTTGKFSIADLQTLSPTGTEGDAVQLWSFGAMALFDPTTGS